jgi:type II secretory pathway component PulJ
MNPIHSMLTRLRHSRTLTRLRRDDGVTLAEMAVTTSIMSAVMAIFTTGVVQLFRAGNNNEMVAMTQSQLNTAFLRLDRNLRYAAGISTPRPDAAGNVAVEYVNTETVTGEPECAQLELNKAARTLRRQVWPQTTEPTGRWAVLANEVDVPQSSFTLLTPGADTGFQRLEVKLTVAGNPGTGHAQSVTRLTFTALNSTRATDPAKVCPEART